MKRNGGIVDRDYDKSAAEPRRFVDNAMLRIRMKRRDLSRYFAPAGIGAPMCSITASANSLHFSSVAPSMRR